MPKKNADSFHCKECDFQCAKQSNWDTHVTTCKHKSIANINKYVCFVCQKSYSARNSLWYHKKKCCQATNIQNNIVVVNDDENIVLTDNNNLIDIVVGLVKSNSELQQQILEICKTTSTNNTVLNSVYNNNNNNNNSNNKTFNLQVFLNETCKDAMNITDFVNSIQLQLTDFENVGEQGYINGISNIIIKNLKALEENMRPVHCSDLKRESIYVKDNNTWEKDTNDNQKLKKAIKAIAHKNTKMIPKYREKYPDSQISSSKASDNYNRFVIEAMGGAGDDDDEKTEKILKRIAKEIVIHKD